jgi:hypothetical protein
VDVVVLDTVAPDELLAVADDVSVGVPVGVSV